mgnify:FL=1
MKLISFNVNSLRAILNKSFKEDFARMNPDIIGIQETKLSDDKNFPFKPDGYEVYWTISKTKKGYSGTAVLTKIKPISIHYGLESGEYDDEGRVITLEFDKFYFVTSYSPNSQDGLKRLEYRQIFENKLREYLIKLDTLKPVILCGDLNVAHEPIDLKHPKNNEMSAGYTIEERNCFSKLLDSGFVDTFRELHPNEIKYSWWSYIRNARATNAGWRIDYFVVSKRLLPQVIRAEILNDIYGSDHCPIELDIKL